METEDVPSLEAQVANLKSTLDQLEQQPEVTEDVRRLKADLQELLELTEHRLLDLKKRALLAAVQNLEEENVDSHVAEVGLQLNDSLIGQRCSVPHWSSNGLLHRQNAVICGVDPSRGLVRVLISAPTRPCDLPCHRFLSGEDSEEEEEDLAAGCGKNGASCVRSHGLPIDAGQLGEFKEPDLARLREGLPCLVKLAGKQLWHYAKVAQIDTSNHQCVVDLRNARDADGAKSCAVKWEDLLPLHNEDEEEEEEESDDFSEWSDDEEEDEEEKEVSEAPRCLPEAPSWERHSTGIASRLMALMGYEAGQGLGARAQGRVEPVPIEVLPPGASLDHVMRLRERRRAREERKAQDGGGKGSAEKAPRKDVFSFLNQTLGPSSSSSSRESNAARAKRLSNASLANLGAELLSAEKEVSSTERRLARLADALSRADVVRAAALRKEEVAARAKLAAAKDAVRCLERHKQQRQDRKKLTVF